MKTIVFGYDDSESAKRALTRVGELAKAFDARVVAVSAAPVLAPAGRGIGPIDPTDPPELHREELSRAKAAFDELGIDATYHVGTGDPADVILEAVEKNGADMIVVGTAGARLRFPAARTERQRERAASRALRRPHRPLTSTSWMHPTSETAGDASAPGMRISAGVRCSPRSRRTSRAT